MCRSLIDSKGNFFGVCGFEVSSLLFKLNYKPVSKDHQRINCLISPIDDRGLILTGALAGGDYNSFSAFINKARSYSLPDSAGNGFDPEGSDSQGQPIAWLRSVSERSQMILYRFEGSDLPAGDSAAELRAGPGSVFAGRHMELRLLPHDSVFSDTAFASVLIISESDYSEILGRNNLKNSGAVSVVYSRRCTCCGRLSARGLLDRSSEVWRLRPHMILMVWLTVI
jgi:hypothetical protein